MSSLLILLYMTIFTAGLFHVAAKTEAVASNWEDHAAGVYESGPIR